MDLLCGRFNNSNDDDDNERRLSCLLQRNCPTFDVFNLSLSLSFFLLFQTQFYNLGSPRCRSFRRARRWRRRKTGRRPEVAILLAGTRPFRTPKNEFLQAVGCHLQMITCNMINNKLGKNDLDFEGIFAASANATTYYHLTEWNINDIIIITVVVVISASD